MNQPPAVVATVWPLNKLDAVMPTLQRIGPSAVMLHSVPSVLKASAPSAAAKVRAALPGARIWLGVAGDAGANLSLAELQRRRLGVGATAEACGAEAVVLNCEARWKTKLPGFTAADATWWVKSLRAAHPAIAIGHSAYDQPTLHGSYPWAAFCGADACEFSQPQIYWAEGGTGPARLAAHVRSWGAARRLGWIDPGCVVYPYLQAHGCRTNALCGVADAFPSVSFWPPFDDDGIRAAAALAAIDRLSWRVPPAATESRIKAAQRYHGLVADGAVGPLTLRALGVT